jgi:hypothetical protein
MEKSTRFAKSDADSDDGEEAELKQFSKEEVESREMEVDDFSASDPNYIPDTGDGGDDDHSEFSKLLKKKKENAHKYCSTIHNL